MSPWSMRAVLGAALVLSVLGDARVGEASVAAALDLEQLTGRAEDVWVARCVAEASRYDDRGRIVTDLTLEVGDSMKGRRRAGYVAVITVLGGAVGDVGMQVPGEARLAVGEEAIVFVRTAGDGRRHPVGLAQGVLPVRRESGRPMVHRGGAGLHLVPSGPSARTGRSAAAVEEPVPLEEMVARIRSIAESQEGTRP